MDGSWQWWGREERRLKLEKGNRSRHYLTHLPALMCPPPCPCCCLVPQNTHPILPISSINVPEPAKFSTVGSAKDILPQSRKMIFWYFFPKCKLGKFTLYFDHILIIFRYSKSVRINRYVHPVFPQERNDNYLIWKTCFIHLNSLD